MSRIQKQKCFYLKYQIRRTFLLHEEVKLVKYKYVFLNRHWTISLIHAKENNNKSKRTIHSVAWYENVHWYTDSWLGRNQKPSPIFGGNMFAFNKFCRCLFYILFVCVVGNVSAEKCKYLVALIINLSTPPFWRVYRILLQKFTSISTIACLIVIVWYCYSLIILLFPGSFIYLTMRSNCFCTKS